MPLTAKEVPRLISLRRRWAVSGRDAFEARLVRRWEGEMEAVSAEMLSVDGFVRTRGLAMDATGDASLLASSAASLATGELRPLVADWYSLNSDARETSCGL